MTPATAKSAERPDPSEPTRPPGRATRRRLLWAGAAGAAILLAVVLIWFQPQALLFDRVVDDEFPTATTVSPAAPEREGAGTSRPAAGDGSTSTRERRGERAAGSADPRAADEEPVSAPTEEGSDGGEARSQASDAAPPAGSASQDIQAEPTVASGPVALSSGTFSSRNRYTVAGRATVLELDDGSRTLRLEDFRSTNGPDLFVYLTVADEADSDAALDADVVDLGVLRGNIGNQNYAIPADTDLDRYDTVVIWCRRFSSGFGAADLLGP
jgi:hypothetical protein